MSKLIPFNFDQSAIRVVEDGGQAWFVGKDICDALGYANPNKAMRDHCKGVTKQYPLSSSGGMQDSRVLSESDVLRLVVRSKLKTAERFERWVFDDVLPTIAKTGSYGQADPMAILSDPAALRGLLANYSEKVLALETTVAAQAPKVEALDRLVTVSDGAVGLRIAAKLLQLPEKQFLQFAHQAGFIFRNAMSRVWQGYSEKAKAGLVEMKLTTVERCDGTTKTVEQVLITPAGLAKLSEAIERRSKCGKII